MEIINILGREGVDAVNHCHHCYHANRSQGRRKSESYCWRRRFFCAAFLFSTSHKSVCSVKIPRHVLPFESLVWLEFHARGWIVLPNQVALTVSVRSLKLQFHCGKTTLSAFPRETPITGSNTQQEAVFLLILHGSNPTTLSATLSLPRPWTWIVWNVNFNCCHSARRFFINRAHPIVKKSVIKLKIDLMSRSYSFNTAHWTVRVAVLGANTADNTPWFALSCYCTWTWGKQRERRRINPARDWLI